MCQAALVAPLYLYSNPSQQLFSPAVAFHRDTVELLVALPHASAPHPPPASAPPHQPAPELSFSQLSAQSLLLSAIPQFSVPQFSALPRLAPSHHQRTCLISQRVHLTGWHWM